MFQVGRSGLATHIERPTPELCQKEPSDIGLRSEKQVIDGVYIENRTFSARKNHIKVKNSHKKDHLTKKITHNPDHSMRLFESGTIHDIEPEENGKNKETKKVSKRRLYELSTPRKFEIIEKTEQPKIEARKVKMASKPKSNKTSELKIKQAQQLLNKRQSDLKQEEEYVKRTKQIEKEEQKRMAATLAHLKAIDIGNFDALKKREVLRVNEKQWTQWKILKEQELSVRESLLTKLVKEFAGNEKEVVIEKQNEADVEK